MSYDDDTTTDTGAAAAAARPTRVQRRLRQRRVRRLRRLRRDRRRLPRSAACGEPRRRRRDPVATGDRHHRQRADDAALVVAAHRSRRDHRAARRSARPPARGAAPGAVDAQGAPGLRQQDPARGERDARGRTGPGRADGAAHRGRPCRRAAGASRGRHRRQRFAPTEARDRGLPRPAPRQLRDPARQAGQDGRCRPPEAVDRHRQRGSADVDDGDEDPTKGFFDQDR